MSENHEESRARRLRLGAELRHQRTLVGKSGREIAQAAGIGQASVSRIENGLTVPSLPQVEAWCDAIGAATEVRQRLARLTEDALNEVESFRSVPAGGLALLQQDVRDLEATARVMRHFQNSHVPGLLQTEAYARQVLELALATRPDDIAAAVAVRMQRQAILADPARRFEFVLTESALRWAPTEAEAGMLAAQLDHIGAMSRLASIAIGVIPAGTPMFTLPISPFIIYDEREDDRQPFVTIELAHAAIYATDPADVEIYRSRLKALLRAALLGDSARAALATLREDSNS